MIEDCYLALIWSLFTSSPSGVKPSSNIRGELGAHSPVQPGFPIQNMIPMFYSTFCVKRHFLIGYCHAIDL